MAHPGATSGQQASRALALAGFAMTIATIATALDYWQVVVIYDPPERAAPLEERIERGQRSVLFAIMPTMPLPPRSVSRRRRCRRRSIGVQTRAHQLLDVRLDDRLVAGSRRAGRDRQGAPLAARVREFRSLGADQFFAPCCGREQAALAFQCQPPSRVVHWREYLDPR